MPIVGAMKLPPAEMAVVSQKILELSRMGFRVDIKWIEPGVVVRAFDDAGNVQVQRSGPVDYLPDAIQDLYVALDVSASELRDRGW